LRLSKGDLADRLETSRSSINRLLDPDNGSVTLSTLVKVANALGKRFNASFS